MLYLPASSNFCPYFPYLLPKFGDIRFTLKLLTFFSFEKTVAV